MTPIDPADEFDICGPLPDRTIVLEASAGTGKTYTIAALATRYVADGLPIDQLLVVTFTRLATGELRDRVRQRLTSARDALDVSLAGDGAPDVSNIDPKDAVALLLATADRATVEARRDRLVRALADFDAATITTTHGFCQEVLGSLGVAGDLDRSPAFSDDARELVDEVADDLYVRAFVDTQPAFGHSEARDIARAAIGSPTTELAASAANGGPALRRGLAQATRVEVDRRKRTLALMTYDDLVTRLRAALEGPHGAAVSAQLRARYRVALVDEFQDTDPDQWAIVRAAFVHEDATLVLIGDPKQAIYAFRGADVYAYLDAARHAAGRATLRTNWRSDQGLLDAYDALFADTRLGHDDIEYRSVRAADPDRSGLHGAPVATPLRIRVVARSGAGVRQMSTGWSQTSSAREFVARDAAADIAGLLLASPKLEDGRRLGAGDIAVLVRKNAQARMIKAALRDAGVPAVLSGAGSVFATEGALGWGRLLEALERPESLQRARAAALSPFFGWTAPEVAGAGEENWDELQQTLHRWAAVLRRSGVATLLEAMSLERHLAARLLSVLGGERDLTDLRQLGELLHAAVVDGRLGITALAAWLRRRIAEVRDAGAEDQVRRLESDAEAVQVLTVHRSKGLEFPVVYCPYLWDPFWISGEPRPVTFHDADRDDERMLDVAMDPQDAAYRRHVAQDQEEQRGEELRLAYVALTRAKHQAVIWWATTYVCRDSPLAHLAFGGTFASQSNDSDSVAARAREGFEKLAASASGSIGLEGAKIPSGEVWSPERHRPAELEVAPFDREVDPRWRRLSYSSITTAAYEARVASEVEEPVGADDAPDHRPLPPVDPIDAEAELADVPSLLSDIPASTGVGIVIHQVLEETDFTASDLTGELASHLANARRRRTIDIGSASRIANGLRAAIETPLGPLVDDLRLRDIPAGDRLSELTFEMPLVGGDTPSGELTLSAIANVLRAHIPPDERLGRYAERLADPMLKSHLRGYLTGTIDLVARAPGGYALIDYKSNRLASPREPLTAWHHRPEAIDEEMQRSHYVLQALFYAVALHRYLRWRAPGYDASRDQVSVLYLFVRGMTGPQTPRVDGTPCGVFAWRPPVGLLPALSEVLQRGDEP